MCKLYKAYSRLSIKIGKIYEKMVNSVEVTKIISIFVQFTMKNRRKIEKIVLTNKKNLLT